MLDVFFFIILIGTTFSFQPFVSAEYVPSAIRVPLLLLCTLISIIFSLKKKRIFYFLLGGGVLLLGIFTLWMHNSSNTLSDSVFVIVLCIFTYCFYSFLKRTPLLAWILTRFWLVLMLVMATGAIGSFITYNLKLLPYTFVHVDQYVYYFNPLFGYVFVKDFGVSLLGRSCHYMLEPSYLAFFLTTNFFFIDSLPFNTLVIKISKAILFLGALCTLSTGALVVFTIVFVIAFFMWLFRKLNVNERILKFGVYAFLIVILIALVAMPQSKFLNSMGNTSYGDRNDRLIESLFILGTSDVQTILFGHSPGFIEKNFSKGESDQFMKLVLEEGVLLTILIVLFLVFCLKKNFKYMLATLIFLNSVVILWTPLFCINIILCRILTENDEEEFLVMDNSQKLITGI